ncbi:MAG TPA: hypothetical protein VHT53_07670 [Candidatus Elarobacter sp.]|nr:hypothetical protein [Candidatus Elarobacter sp.]
MCPAYPAGAIVLGAANVVPGSTFAAIDAAYAYQNAHAWPTKHPAHPELSGTSVYVEQRGAFSFVSFVDDPRLAPGWDTCNGQEFYRVSPGSFVVLPYRGCLVSGDDIPLPRMDQLPG